MAYIRKRKKSYRVVYRINDADGMEHQKEMQKKEIEYKQYMRTTIISWRSIIPIC